MSVFKRDSYLHDSGSRISTQNNVCTICENLGHVFAETTRVKAMIRGAIETCISLLPSLYHSEGSSANIIIYIINSSTHPSRLSHIIDTEHIGNGLEDI